MMELGVYSFGNVGRGADGRLGSTAGAVRDAKDRFYRCETTAYETFAHKRRMPVRDRAAFDAGAGPGGMTFAGGTEEVAPGVRREPADR